MEAAKGATRTIRYAAQDRCDPCDGSGAAPGSSRETCRVCGGSGVQTVQQGFFHLQQTCGACGGRGSTISKPCETCTGNGRVRATREVEVTIPEGVYDGITMNLQGKGEAGEQGAPSGNLRLHLRVREHPVFERDGTHVHVMAPISVADAVLGGTVQVPTLDGTVEVKIKAGTQPDTRQRLRRRGIKRLNGGERGDMFVHVKVVIPKYASEFLICWSSCPCGM